jgi:hypothetical protein
MPLQAQGRAGEELKPEGLSPRVRTLTCVRLVDEAELALQDRFSTISPACNNVLMRIIMVHWYDTDTISVYSTRCCIY